MSDAPTKPVSLKKRFLNLPNYITMGRIVAVFALAVVMDFIRPEAYAHLGWNRMLSFASAIVFLAAMASDLVDGWIARRHNIVSTFGQFFDPLADKLMFLVAMLYMVDLDRLPAWIVAIFLSREVIVTALRGLAIDEGIIIAASQWGKYKQAFTSAATGALLFHYPFFGIDWRLIGWVFIWPALIFSVASGLHYIVGFVKALRELNRSNKSGS